MIRHIQTTRKISLDSFCEFDSNFPNGGVIDALSFSLRAVLPRRQGDTRFIIARIICFFCGLFNVHFDLNTLIKTKIALQFRYQDCDFA